MIASRFSVVIPLYNKADYVADAVLSACTQEPAPLEVIVVDDGSTDGGARRVIDLGLSRVRVFCQANAGVSAARNAGMKEARGDWIAFLDADDCFQPGHLASLDSLAQQFPQAGLLATGYCRLRSDGSRVPVRLDFGPGILNDFYGRWSRLTFACADSIALRREVVEANGIEFEIGQRLGEDQDVWFRMAEAAPVAYVGTTLVDYRLDVAGSATATTPRPAELLSCYLRLSERLAEGRTPMALRAGARRLVGSHWVNTARALHERGARSEAWALWRSHQARGNLLYWLRTGASWLVGGR